VLLVVPLLLPALPTSLDHAINKFEPITIGNAMTSVNTHLGSGSAPTFNAWVGLAIMAGYAALALGIGGWRMMRRDA